jgi:hypothetical protein
MRLDTLDVYHKAWYKCHDIKRRTFYNYKNIFINGDVRVVNGNNGLQKLGPNIVAIISSINRIVEKNLDNFPHLTRLISQDGTRENLKLFLSNMSQCSVRKIENEEIKPIGFYPVSQFSFSKVMRRQFLDVTIAKKKKYLQGARS